MRAATVGSISGRRYSSWNNLKANSNELYFRRPALKNVAPTPMRPARRMMDSGKRASHARDLSTHAMPVESAAVTGVIGHLLAFAQPNVEETLPMPDAPSRVFPASREWPARRL